MGGGQWEKLAQETVKFTGKMKLNDHNFVIEIRLQGEAEEEVVEVLEAKLPIRKTTDIYTRNSLTCKKSSKIPRHNIQVATQY